MIIVAIKGFMVELMNIQEIFTTIDFSCNGFDGPIPKEMGEFKVLHILNLSHNAFTSQILSSLGKMRSLESLDQSSNKLFGKIPVQLAGGLIFLSFLDLSFNQLVGQIPSIKQFATFLETSYEGNQGLICGFPLKSHCTYEESPRLWPPTYKKKHWNYGIVIEWNYIRAKLGFVFGFRIIIGPLMFWRSWGYGITNMLTTFFLGSSPNCILEENIITGSYMETKGRGTSHSYCCFGFAIKQNKKKWIRVIGCKYCL